VALKSASIGRLIINIIISVGISIYLLLSFLLLLFLLLLLFSLEEVAVADEALKPAECIDGNRASRKYKNNGKTCASAS